MAGCPKKYATLSEARAAYYRRRLARDPAWAQRRAQIAANWKRRIGYAPKEK